MLRKIASLFAMLAIGSCGDISRAYAPNGIASKMTESTVELPRSDRYKALFEMSQRMIVVGEFPAAEDFLDSLAALYELNGKLYFQLGGSADDSRAYRAMARIREIPGVDTFTQDSAAWWQKRGDQANAYTMSVIGGALSQELYTEQMLGP